MADTASRICASILLATCIIRNDWHRRIQALFQGNSIKIFV